LDGYHDIVFASDAITLAESSEILSLFDVSHIQGGAYLHAIADCARNGAEICMETQDALGCLAIIRMNFQFIGYMYALDK